MEHDQIPSFIQRIEGNDTMVPQSFANALVANKKNLYRMIDNMGFYLPTILDQAVTTDYLLKVPTG